MKCTNLKSVFVGLFALFIILANPVQGISQQNYNVKGIVVDSVSNETMPYATIAISHKNNPAVFIKRLAANDKGAFTTTVNASGDYILVAIMEGKETKILPFTIKEGNKETDLGTIYLSELGGTLSNVVVRVQKPLVKMEIDKLTYDAESDPDSKSENVLEMLRKVPMVTIDAEENIQLKGSSSFKVYINGKPSSIVASNPSQVLKSMPASNIKNIEVITDPGAKYDAEGLAGIINITTAKNTTDGYTGNINLGATTLNTYNGSGYITAKYGKFSLSGNLGYVYWENPENIMDSRREDYLENTVLSQNGIFNNKGPRLFGGAEITFELDTLNMFSLGFSHFNGNVKLESDLRAAMTQNATTLFSYLRQTDSKSGFGGTDINANYQRSFRKKGMTLTASYRYGYSPNDSENDTEVKDTFNFKPIREHSESDASSKEHSAQIDFVTPINQMHTIEAGAKYIYRDNTSDVTFNQFNFNTSNWENNHNRENNLDYRQGIFSVYGAYGLRFKKIGFKAGIRMENTDINADFSDRSSASGKLNIESNSFDFVPSLNLTYQLSMTKSLRLAYNMRIQRPGISHLNPYLNDSDPLNISSGNPYLNSEKSNNLSLTYSSFSQLFNLNASFNYSFVNNAIQDYTTIRDSVTYKTYANIGKNQNVGLNLFTSWMPFSNFRIFINGNGSYIDIKNDNKTITSSGFSAQLFGGISYNFLKSFRAGLHAGYFKNPNTLQREIKAISFMAVSLGKDFFNKKLSVNIMLQEPFRKNMDMTLKTKGTDFYQVDHVVVKRQQVGFSVSYKFGELKSQVKKIQRGITNDDVMQGQTQGEQPIPSTGM